MSPRFLVVLASLATLLAGACSGGDVTAGPDTASDTRDDATATVDTSADTGDEADTGEPLDASSDLPSTTDVTGDDAPQDVSATDAVETSNPDQGDIAHDAGEDAEEPPEIIPESPRRSLAEGFHVPPTPMEAGESFSMIVASDPQLWWNFVDGVQGISDEEVEEQTQRHIDAMNVLIAGESLPAGHDAPIALVMNGDLTEYGRWNQWDAYYRLYEGVNAPIYDGLGNHDNENNNFYASNGCGLAPADLDAWTAACNAGSTATLWDVPACDVARTMLFEVQAWCASDTMRRTRYWLRTHADHLFDYDEGSAAYSWEMGDIHFIQLHTQPDYEIPETQICSTIPWLKNDLKAAVERGKKIVIHMHKPIRSSMREVLEGYQYDIVGIFYGHYHRYVGYDGDFEVGGVGIPTFHCGSMEWNIFALAQFDADRMTVTAIDSNTGAPVHYATAAEYDNVGGAYVSDPFTYVFPTHDCPAGQIPAEPGGECVTPTRETPAIELCY